MFILAFMQNSMRTIFYVMFVVLRTCFSCLKFSEKYFAWRYFYPVWISYCTNKLSKARRMHFLFLIVFNCLLCYSLALIRRTVPRYILSLSHSYIGAKIRKIFDFERNNTLIAQNVSDREREDIDCASSSKISPYGISHNSRTIFFYLSRCIFQWFETAPNPETLICSQYWQKQN